jgi:hypothetical protein
MHPTTTRRLDVAAALLLLVGCVWATGVLAIVWAADLDGSGGSSAVAGVSAVLLAIGVLVAVVLALVVRRWRAMSLVLLLSAVVAALPWLGLLG